MEEQAQLAKLRRAIIRRLPKIGLTSLLKLLPLSEAETEALLLRSVQKTRHLSPTTTFAIPLVGAHQVSNWPTIEETLTRTLNNLLAQSDPNWRAVICSQTEPNCVGLEERITFLPFRKKIDGHDKVEKLKALSRHCLLEDCKPGFFMPMDGDDLLANDFIASLHTDTSLGWVADGGYILNSSNGRVGYTKKRSLREITQKPFWKFCGSCMALPVGNDPEKEANFFAALVNHEHRLYPFLAELAGYPLNYSEIPQAMYLINHGENFETRRGRGGFKQRFAEKFAVKDPAKLSEIAARFPSSENLINQCRDAP